MLNSTVLGMTRASLRPWASIVGPKRLTTPIAWKKSSFDDADPARSRLWHSRASLRRRWARIRWALRRRRVANGAGDGLKQRWPQCLLDAEPPSSRPHLRAE